MTVSAELLTRISALPPELQREVLDFVEFLGQRQSSKPPKRSSRGLWANLDIEVTEEDIEVARREMWSGFPREDIA